MALVLMATHGWGTLFVDPADLEAGVGLQSSFTNPADATAVTHYADDAGGSPSTGPVTADASGRLMRYVEEGTYDQTLPGGTVLEVQAVSGSTLSAVGTRVAVIDEVAWAHDPAFGGAEMDDPTVNNVAAVGNGITTLATSGGGELNFVPGKTYGFAHSSDGSDYTAKHNITLKGNGATWKRIPTGNALDANGFPKFRQCDDLKLLDLDVDVNNIERYGGIGLYGCARPLIQNCYAYDSNLNASWITYDHYWLVLNKDDDGTPTTDAVLLNIRADDVELVEADNCRGFQLSHFLSRRAGGTVGVGLFTVSSGETALDYEISHGRIIDARKRYISLSHETGGPDNNTFKRFKVKDVQCLKLSDTGGTTGMVLIGNVGSSSSGNVYEDFELEDLLLYADPATADFVTPMLNLHVVSSNEFLRAKLKNITIVGDCGAGEWAADLRRLKDCEINGLKVRGATLGVNMSAFQDCRVFGLDVEGSTTDAQIVSSRGGNIIEVANGTVSTGGAHATDALIQRSDVPKAIASPPWRHEINVFATASTHTNFGTTTQVSTALMGGRRESTGAQNAEIGWDVVLSEGTWRFEIYHHRSTDRGIYTFSLDGVDVGTIDGYNAGSSANILNSISGITVASTGKKRLLIKMATKNASSSSYFGIIHSLTLQRTA